MPRSSGCQESEWEAWNYKNLDRSFRYDLVFNAIERGILIKRYTSDLRMECQDRHRLPNQFATRLAASLSPFESVSVNLYEEMPRMRLCLALKIEECDDDEVERPINWRKWSTARRSFIAQAISVNFVIRTSQGKKKCRRNYTNIGKRDK